MVKDDTINISERIAPYLNPDSSVAAQSAEILRHICRKDKYNALIL
jgi:hypothetical protein